MSYIEKNIPVFQTVGHRTNQTSVNTFIKAVHDSFIEAGLIKSALIDQLDVTNIPTLDISSIFTTVRTTQYNHLSNVGIDIPFTDNARVIKHKPLEYMLDDTQKPVKIKLEFYYFHAILRSTITGNESPMLGCYLTIDTGYNTYRKNCILPYSYNLNAGTAAAVIDTWPLTDTMNIIDAKRPSIISYNKESGHLFVNIIPSAYSGYSCGSKSQYGSFITFSLTRSRDFVGRLTGDYVRFISPPTLCGSGQASSALYGAATFNLSPQTSGTYTITSVIMYLVASLPPTTLISNQYISPSTISYSNYSFYTYMSSCLNTVNNTSDLDPFVLIGANEMAGSTTTTLYKIKLNETTTKTYIALSPLEFYLNVDATVNYCLLIQIEK